MTAAECIAVFTEWANHYPCARFAVLVIEPDGSSGYAIGWGLAMPDHVFAYLPATGISGRFRTAGDLLALLNVGAVDAHLVWVDAEPEYWPDDDPDEEDVLVRT
jgi:hypothetical protein